MAKREFLLSGDQSHTKERAGEVCPCITLLYENNTQDELLCVKRFWFDILLIGANLPEDTIVKVDDLYEMHGSVVRLWIHGTKNFMRIKHEGKYRNRVVTDKAFEEHLSEDIIVRLIN